MTAIEGTQGLLLPQALDARGIVDILRRHHSPPDRWLFLTELMPGTGVGGGERRIDAWAMHCWPSARVPGRLHDGAAGDTWRNLAACSIEGKGDDRG